MFEKFTNRYINEAKDPVYKKGQKVVIQLTHKGGVGKYAGAMSKSKNTEEARIVKRVKNKITGGYKYELDNYITVGPSEIVGLAESVEEASKLSAKEFGKWKQEREYIKQMADNNTSSVYKIADYVQFLGLFTQKQWEMFMYGRYEKDLQKTDPKTKNKIYKVLQKMFESVDETVNEAKVTAKTIDKLTNEIAVLTKELKDNFALYKKAKTDEDKKKHMQIAADKTKEKRAKDAELEKAIQNFGADMELDITFENKDLVESIKYALNEKTAKFVLQTAQKYANDADAPKAYIKDYLKSIERMARKSPQLFVKRYGDYSRDDWEEDVIYNLQNESIDEARGHSSTQFFDGVRANDGDLFHSKRHGLAVKKGDKLYLFYAWQGEPKLGKVYKTDKLHKHLGPATPELVKTYYRDSEKAMADYANKLEESVNEKAIKGKDAGNYIKMAPKGRKLHILGTKDGSDQRDFISLGKGKWEEKRTGEKLSWIELSSIASALGDTKVFYEGEVNENENRVYGMFTDDQGKPTKLDKELLDIALKGLPSKIVKNIDAVEANGYGKSSHISPPTVSNKGQSRGEIEYHTIGIGLLKPMGRNKITAITLGLRKRTSGPGTGYLFMKVAPDWRHTLGPDAQGAIEFWDDPSYFLQKLYNEKFKNWF